MKKKILLLILMIVFVCGCDNKTVANNVGNESNNGNQNTPPVEVKKLKIVDENSNQRPLAVMINNISDARSVQSGLNKAYIVYEIIVEGGISRYMALFKDIDDVTIGSIRSVRHYYLDYVMENDAILINWGYSPQAVEDIKTFGIDQITGLAYEGKYFYRIKTIGAPHNGFAKYSTLRKAVSDLKVRSTTDKGLLLNYSVDPVVYEDAFDATKVDLTYSNSLTNHYVYDEETKMYVRSRNTGSSQIDHNDDSKVVVKNIIAYEIKNDTITADSKNRQNLYNTGSGEGYYITEGKAIKITWEKSSRGAKTVYKHNGEEIKVNDGNTFIQIVPKAGSIKVS